MKRLVLALVIAGGLVLPPGAVWAAATAEQTLDKCQRTVAKESRTYIAAKVKQAAKCLDKISKERILHAAGDAAGAAKACAGAFRKLVNMEHPSKTLAAKMEARIEKACDRAVNLDLLHTEADVLGSGSTVTGDTIDSAPQMAIPCLGYGGDGGFGSMQEWVDCLVAMGDRAAARQVHLQYPLADAWLRDVRADITALGPGQKYVDAVTALDAMRRWVDNGDGTVTDYVTGLMWEQKDDSGGIHDKDDVYTWSTVGNDGPDGTVFTVFLDTLNGASGAGECDSVDGVTQSGGFAGHCDWRLPTTAELQTILLEPFPCGVNPCIDQTIFGPTVSSFYWSSTTVSPNPVPAWIVSFFSGFVSNGSKPNAYYVRAVRGGL